MILKIKCATPILNKDSDFHYSVSHWEIFGTITPDCNCASLAKQFEVNIAYPKMVGVKQEIYQKTKDKLKEDGK